MEIIYSKNCEDGQQVPDPEAISNDALWGRQSVNDALWGRQSVADALARACAKAVDDDDMDTARRFAAAHACVLELFPRLTR